MMRMFAVVCASDASAPVCVSVLASYERSFTPATSYADRVASMLRWMNADS